MTARSVPIIMRAFSISHPVLGVRPVETDVRDVSSGSSVAHIAQWSEEHGDTVISVSEVWFPSGPNIWLATSLKK